MPRTMTIEKTVFKFLELSKKAQERALDKFREWACDDSYWYESIYEDTARIFDILGIHSERLERWHNVTTHKSGTRTVKPDISFSGFCSQGDGASFEGTWNYKRGMVKAIKAYAPQDSELQEIAEGLQEMQRRYFYKLTARMVRRDSHYCHENTIGFEFELDGDTWRNISDDVTGGIEKYMRRLMRWIYRQLEAEYNYQTSDEAITESIEANDYEFDESGRLA